MSVSVFPSTLTLCITFLLFTVRPAAEAQTKQPERSPAQFDRFMTQQMDSASIPGLAIAIIRNSRITYSKGYGLLQKGSSQAVTASTIFEAASLTKPVFAYAVLQLAEQGLLDLNKPLYEYLPYPDVAADERYKKITARLVLSHRTGLPNWRKDRRSSTLAMIGMPGERFGYSGEGFVYLQKVVEKITGQPINDYMTEHVLKPLGMSNSSFVWIPEHEAQTAHPHNAAGDVEEKFKPQQANMAYSLHTTADDYARFIEAIFTNKGLKVALVNQMLSPQTQLPIKFSGSTLSNNLFWGLGFGLERANNRMYFWHWGDNGTFKCYIAADRMRKDAMIYFTNSINGLKLIDSLTQHLLGYTPATAAFLSE